MSTIGEAISAAEGRVFVGRSAELEVFGRFLASGDGPPAVLKVNGPGGAGKSALLRAFGRAAAEAGRDVVALDAYSLGSGADAFMEGLAGCLGAADPVAALNDRRAVVLVDGLESLFELTPFLQTALLPRLQAGVKVVLAGRQPLGRLWAGWADLVWQLTLPGLGRVDTDEYLRRRGVDDDAVQEEIWGASFGHPLAVALAADMAKLGVRHFSANADWHLAVRQLAANLLRDVDDPTLVALLEAASVVRQFDEALLAAVADVPDAGVGEAFVRLCQLSVVRAGDRGLALHDELRHILFEDLRWRHPDRAKEFQRRALAHLRERMRVADPAEMQRLAVEQTFFLQDAFIHGRVFDETPGVWLHSPRPEPDHVRRVHRAWTALVGDSPVAPPADELSAEFVERLVHCADAAIPLARTRDGAPLAYGFLLPLTAAAFDLFEPDGTLGRLLRQWAANGYDPPERAADATAHFMSTIALAGPEALPGLGPVTRAGLEYALRPARYLAATREPLYTHFLGTMGFHPWPGAAVDEPGRDGPVVLHQLDLLGAGVEALLDAIVEDRGLPLTLWGAALERAIEAVLGEWADDRALAASALAGWAAMRHPEASSPAAAVRAMIEAAMAQAGSGQGEEGRLALRAVELGFLRRDVSQEAAFTRMSVSRATFYRLRRRGIQLVAQAIAPT